MTERCIAVSTSSQNLPKTLYRKSGKFCDTILVSIFYTKQMKWSAKSNSREHRRFQLERMMLFSDAVFAIVITLMVIEIKVPDIMEVGRLNKEQLYEHLINLLPHLLGYIVSFLMIGLFWIDHHRAFGYVINYDKGLIWNNLFLLMVIGLLPFTAALGAEFGYLTEAFMIYSLNLALIAFINFLLWLKISNPKRNLSTGLENKNLRKFLRMKSFIIACIFLISALMCMSNANFLLWTGRFIFFLIFPAIAILKRAYSIGPSVF